MVSWVAWMCGRDHSLPPPSRQVTRTIPMDQRLLDLLTRIAEALERLAPPPPAPVDLDAADAFVWHPAPPHLAPVPQVSRGRHRRCCRASSGRSRSCSTTRCASPRGLPANNAMLWGARGMGKSSLVKAAHAVANARASRQPGADRNPPRGHPHPAGPAERAARPGRGAA